MNLAHLRREDELHVIVELGFQVPGFRFQVPGFISLYAVFCIRDKPILLLFEELLILSGTQNLGTFLGIEQLQILGFGIIHTLIVNLRQSIQFLTQLLKLCRFSGIL